MRTRSLRSGQPRRSRPSSLYGCWLCPHLHSRQRRLRLQPVNLRRPRPRQRWLGRRGGGNQVAAGRAAEGGSRSGGGGGGGGPHSGGGGGGQASGGGGSRSGGNSGGGSHSGGGATGGGGGGYGVSRSGDRRRLERRGARTAATPAQGPAAEDQRSRPARRRTRRKRTRGPARQVDGERQRRRQYRRQPACVTAPATSRLTPVRVTDTTPSRHWRFRVVLCLPRPEAEAASTSRGYCCYGYGYYDPWGYGCGSGYGLRRVLRRLLRSVVRRVSHVSAIHLHIERRGSLKLKIKPREAEVYVDGYFVGIVDDFDGIFSSCTSIPVPTGSMVRAPGVRAARVRCAHHAGTHDHILGRAARRFSKD